MADKNCSGLGVLGTTTGTCCGGDKSTCIDVNKIYDSAKDKICIEDLRVFVGNEGQSIIDNASNIRCNGAEVIWAQISVHDIAFNKGYYSVDIRYYFRICFEACVGGNAREFCGIAVYDKSTILFGGDGNVSIFTSEATSGGICAGCLAGNTLTESVSNMPKVTLEVATPICLAVKTVEKNYNYGCCCCTCDQIPEPVLNLCDCAGLADDTDGCKRLYVTLGLFTLIRIERPVSILIESAEYCIPDRESNVLSDSTTDPCTIFKNMAFPTCEFYPPSFGAVTGGLVGGETCKECPPERVLGTTDNNCNNCNNNCNNDCDDDCNNDCSCNDKHHHGTCGCGNNSGPSNGCRPCKCR